MNRILAAVDGSEASVHAAKAAINLASKVGAQVTLVHVTAPPPPTMFPPEVPLTVVADTRDAEMKQGQSLLDSVAQQLQVSVEKRNLWGPVAEMLADLAVDESYDLVVVGNTGRNAVSRMLLGSVADRLVHICQRPVMVVR